LDYCRGGFLRCRSDVPKPKSTVSVSRFFGDLCEQKALDPTQRWFGADPAAFHLFDNVMARLAEMERELTIERTRAGLVARQLGRIGGRNGQGLLPVAGSAFASK
jgi:hypothetical protein